MDIPQKKLDRKYIAVLAVVAGLILLLGTWARPKPVKTEGPPAQSPVELMRLQRMTQIRNVQEISTLFSETAASTSRHLAWIPEHHLTGLILDDDGARRLTFHLGLALHPGGLCLLLGHGTRKCHLIVV